MTFQVKNGIMSDEEVLQYAKILSEKNNNTPLKSLTLTLGKDDEGEYVDCEYTLEQVPFQRIRRITGYLVGTLDRFNDAKKAEVLDRVSHST